MDKILETSGIPAVDAMVDDDREHRKTKNNGKRRAKPAPHSAPPKRR